MKIINELAKTSIERNKKDTLATKLSILMAVILLGSIIFIINSNKSNEYNYIKTFLGDYHVSLSQVNEKMYDYILDWDEVNKLEFTKSTDTNLNAVLYEKNSNSWKVNSIEITKGRKPEKTNEIIVPNRFLVNNKEYSLNSHILIHDKQYKIVGTFNDSSVSFETSVFYGILDDLSKESLFKSNDSISVDIWYKNPRDTYTNTRILLNEFNIDSEKAKSTGQLYYNAPILEFKMIYPSGIIPPKNVIIGFLEYYIPIILLASLFAVMIYGAFNVWNNRDIKEIALLKSVGMTEKQVRKLIKKKALKLSIVPTFIGTFLSYGISNLLLYLMWLNNAISYRNLSEIFKENLATYEFQLVELSIVPIILTIVTAFITVYFSALVPARRSSKLSIIEGLKGIINSKKKIRNSKSKISLKIEKSLAKDYLKSYKSTYRTMTIAMTMAALTMTVVLVSQSYRHLETKYNTFDNPYNLSSTIFTDSKIDRNLLSDLHKLENVDEIHIYGYKNFKFFLDDNKTVVSDEMSQAINKNLKGTDSYLVTIYGLEENDFNKILEDNEIEKGNDKFVLLNKTCLDENIPYQFRDYIPLSNNVNAEIGVRYNANGNLMNIPISGFIESFPYKLEAYNKRGVYIFTTLDSLEHFIEKNGQDEGDPVNDYRVRLKTTSDLNIVTKDYRDTISSYIAKSDYFSSNDIVEEAAYKEQLRNEHLLNLGIQCILLIIALSNAYNSFHGNLRARKRDFQLLISTGMTGKQINKMIFLEGSFILLKTIIIYLIVFVLLILGKSYRQHLIFSPFEILVNINFIPIILLFVITAFGIFYAIHSGKKNILNDDLMDTISQI